MSVCTTTYIIIIFYIWCVYNASRVFRGGWVALWLKFCVYVYAMVFLCYSYIRKLNWDTARELSWLCFLYTHILLVLDNGVRCISFTLHTYSHIKTMNIWYFPLSYVWCVNVSAYIRTHVYLHICNVCIVYITENIFNHHFRFDTKKFVWFVVRDIWAVAIFCLWHRGVNLRIDLNPLFFSS